MALLYPGLKVKCVRGELNIGKTAIVVSTLPANELVASLGLTLTVKWNEAVQGYHTGSDQLQTFPPGTETVDDPNDFEPIIPEGELHEQEYEVVEELEA